MWPTESTVKQSSCCSSTASAAAGFALAPAPPAAVAADGGGGAQPSRRRVCALVSSPARQGRKTPASTPCGSTRICARGTPAAAKPAADQSEGVAMRTEACSERQGACSTARPSKAAGSMPARAWKVHSGSASARNSVVPKTTASAPRGAPPVAFQHGCGDRSSG